MTEHETGETLLEAEPTTTPSAGSVEPVDTADMTPQPAPRAGLALVRGFPDAMRTLFAWVRRPHRVLVPWLALSFGIGVVLLLAVWAVAELSPAGTRPPFMPALPARDVDGHVWYLFQRNLLVVALHGFACLAGYIVYASLTDPTLTPGRRMGAVTRATASIALVFVPAATLLSMTTQAWILGSYASTAAAHSYVSVRDLLMSTLGHSLLELTAVFLPLAAWLVARRRGRAHELYAATIASVLIALPMIYGAAWIEGHHWHKRVAALDVDRPDIQGKVVATMLRDMKQPTDATELSIGPAIKQDRQYLDESKLFNDGVLTAMESRTAVVAIQFGVGWYLYELHGRDIDACTPGSASGKPRPVKIGDGEPVAFVRVREALPNVDPLSMRAIFGPFSFLDPGDMRVSMKDLGAGACTSTR